MRRRHVRFEFPTAQLRPFPFFCFCRSMFCVLDILLPSACEKYFNIAHVPRKSCELCADESFIGYLPIIQKASSSHLIPSTTPEFQNTPVTHTLPGSVQSSLIPPLLIKSNSRTCLNRTSAARADDLPGTQIALCFRRLGRRGSSRCCFARARRNAGASSEAGGAKRLKRA